MPIETKAYRALDGSIHESFAQASAIDLVLLLDISAVDAWKIIKKRQKVIDSLQAIDKTY